MATEAKSEESYEPTGFSEVESSNPDAGTLDGSQPPSLATTASSASSGFLDELTRQVMAQMSEYNLRDRDVASVVLSDVVKVAEFYEAQGKSPQQAFKLAQAELRKSLTRQGWFKGLGGEDQNTLRDLIGLKGKAKTTPTGQPLKYAKEYQQVFAEFPVESFRQHLAEKHPELKRQELPPKGQREKATQILAQVNGIIRGFGFLIGLKRVKARTKKGESDYIEKIFEEREELRELVYGKIMIPMLKHNAMAHSQAPAKPSLLEQDALATAQQPPSEPSTMPQVPQAGSPQRPFRIGAIIDIEKLNISTEALRDVLMGRTRTPAQPPAQPVQGGGGQANDDRRLAPDQPASTPDQPAPQTIPPAVQQTIDENADEEFKQRIASMPKTTEAVQGEIEGLQARLQAQREIHGGRETPAVLKLEGNLRALRAVANYLNSPQASNRRRLPDAGTQTPPAPTPAKPAVPHDATKDKLKKKNLRPFVPSRRRVLQKTRNLVLRRPSRTALSTLDEVRPYPENVNSFAPDPVETVRGRFRAIM